MNNNLREALADVKAQATKGKETAAKKLGETALLLREYTTQHEGHTAEMQRVQKQIQTINSDVDMAVLDISTDCIDKCKTGLCCLFHFAVLMPYTPPKKIVVES